MSVVADEQSANRLISRQNTYSEWERNGSVG